MSKIKLEALDNKNKPTGNIVEFQEETAKRILAMPKSKWKEVKESSSKKETDKK